MRFAAVAVVVSLSPSTYGRESRAVASRQIHFSAWQALPGFVLACAVLSFVLIRIVVDSAREYGLPQYALDLTIRVLVLELIPLFAAIFVALRSGAAICTEVATMSAGGELERLDRAGRDPLRVELVPRAIGSLVAVMVLAWTSGVVAMALAYEGLYGLSPWALDAFVRGTGQVFDPVTVAGFLMKTALFGAVVGAIPIVGALGARGGADTVPDAVRRGMVRLGAAVALVELLFLAVMYA